MLLEDILLVVAIGVVLLMAGPSLFRFLKVAPLRRRDPLAEARERLRIANLEAEAARVNREADRVYEHLYEETMADDRGGGGTRVAGDEAAHDADEPIEKGKRHGQG
jgi:hypothetical protein